MQDMINLSRKLPGPEVVKPLISKYLSSVKNFRQMVTDLKLNLEEAPVMEGIPITTLKVEDNASTCMKMLARMKSARATRLQTKSSCADHLQDAIRCLSAPLDLPLVTSWKNGVETTRNSGTGAENITANNQWEPSSTTKPLLLTTTIVHMKQRSTADDQILIKKNN